MHAALLLPFCASASPAFFGAENNFQSYKYTPLKPQKVPGNPGQVQYIWKHSQLPSNERAAFQINRTVVTILPGTAVQIKPIAHQAGARPHPQTAPLQMLPQPQLLSSELFQSKESQPSMAIPKHLTLGNSQTSLEEEPWGPATAHRLVAPRAAPADSVKHSLRIHMVHD